MVVSVYCTHKESVFMNFQEIAAAFALRGEVVCCKEFGSGHINNTFKVTTDANKHYVLQHINKHVFKNPRKLMENVCAVTDYVRGRCNDQRAALHFLPTHSGEYFYLDEKGEFWRLYDFVGGFTLDLPESDEDFYQSALAFGRFQELLKDFPAESLHETIPNFHNTPDRFRQFKDAVEQDAAGRRAAVQADIDQALALEGVGCKLQQMLDAGLLPLRVTHNDTKLNNVLLDCDTRKSLCVLDLDTVMPGLSAHDFGDSIRFGAATAAEDEPDTSKMKLDLHLFEVYTRGFLEATTSLTETEIRMLPMGAVTMTLEVAIRFLGDYLNGDVYFKTAYPEHNLVRARAQLALVQNMLAKMDQMERIVKQLAELT